MAKPSSSQDALDLGTPTGIFALDDAIGGGIKPGQLVVLAGPTGGGKSALSTQIALYAAQWAAWNNKGDVLYFSYEMNAPELTNRLIIQATPEIRDGFHAPAGWSERDRPFVEASRKKISELPMRINEKGSGDWISLKAEIRDNTQSFSDGRRPALVVVDHIGLIGSADSGSDQEILDRVVRGLKTIATDLKVPVLALAQFSRKANSKNPDNRPLLSDLRGSSAIVSDANIVLLLHTPYIYLHDIEERRRLVASGAPVTLFVAKNRSGAQTDIDLEWVGPHLTFRERPH